MLITGETGVTRVSSPSSIISVITRRQAILSGLGFPSLLAVVPATAFASKEFWNGKMPSEWTDAEIHQLLNQSPWAKDGSISDTTQRGSFGSTAGGGGGGSGRRRGRGAASPSGATANTGPLVKWKATVRWESALPIREALYRGAPGELPEDYILNVLGEVPGVDPDSGDAILKENTTLEHKGDQIKMNRVELAPKNSVSEAGTLFYFSRLFALKLEDQEVTFTTKLGPLKVKCKFTLKDMLYRGNLEL
jgi:hypothetical protein